MISSYNTLQMYVSVLTPRSTVNSVYATTDIKLTEKLS